MSSTPPRRAQTTTARPATTVSARRGGSLLSVLSTVVVLGIVAAGVRSLPGWSVVKKSFFNGKYFRESFDEILGGFWLNIRIFCIAFALCLLLGLLVAVIRQTTGPLSFPFRLIAVAYTDVFRGVPSIVLIYIFGFGVPQSLQLDRPWNNPLIWGTVAIVLNSAAYVAEVFRSGIRSIHPSQMAAARSLGLSRGAAMRSVIIPQAARRVVPPLVNDFIAVVQSTALLSTLGPLEALREAQNYGSKKFNFTPYFGATLLFLLVTIPLARFADYLMRRQEAQQR